MIFHVGGGGLNVLAPILFTCTRLFRVHIGLNVRGGGLWYRGYDMLWCFISICFCCGVVKYSCKVSLTSAIFSSMPSCCPYCFNSFNLPSTWTSYSTFLILFPSPSSSSSSSSSVSVQLSSLDSVSLVYSSSSFP